MKQKVMTVVLSTENADARLYYYAELMLPAQSHEVRDAFQRARFHEGDDAFHDINIVSCPVLPQLENLRLDSPAIKELEFFAARVDALPVEEIIALKGVFQQYLDDGRLGEVVSMKDLINMTYGLDQVMVAANVGNDEALGQFVIENDLHQNISEVPEESLFLLDRVKIGQLQRKCDQGVYRITELEAPEGYLLLTDYVYTGQLPEEALKLNFTVVNATAFELPKTGTTSMTLMPIALLLCTATFVGVLIYLRKKKKES